MNQENNKQRFDQAMTRILSVSKQELRRRLETDARRLKIGKKRGPKPSAFRDPDASGQN